jgi:hypothetical protein
MLYAEYFVKFVIKLYMLEKQETHCIKCIYWIYLFSVEKQIIQWRPIFIVTIIQFEYFSAIGLGKQILQKKVGKFVDFLAVWHQY